MSTTHWLDPLLCIVKAVGLCYDDESIAPNLESTTTSLGPLPFPLYSTSFLSKLQYCVIILKEALEHDRGATESLICVSLFILSSARFPSA